MNIEFLDEKGTVILIVVAGDVDHWTACQVGLNILTQGVVLNAVDFQIVAEHPILEAIDEPRNELLAA